MRRAVIDAERPDADVLAEAAAIIERGGIVAMPTDTLYGLAADPFSLAAVSRLFAVKGRAADRAVALVAADIARVLDASDVELLLDAGKTPGGPPSTIVSVRHDDIRLVRPGAIDWDEVQACVSRA